MPFASTPEQFFIGRKPLDQPVQSASTFKNFDKPYIGWQITRAAGFRDGQGKRLKTVILQHQMRHRIGHRRK